MILDRVLETISFLSILCTLGISLIYFPSLPDVLPIHYNEAGIVDGYGNKLWIWSLVAIPLVIFASIYYLINHSKFFSAKYHESNDQLIFVSRMLRMTTTSAVLVFAYITYITIQNGIGNTTGLGSHFTLVSNVMFLGPMVYYIIRIYRIS